MCRQSVPGRITRFAGIDGLETFSTSVGSGSLSISKVIALQDGMVTFTERIFRLFIVFEPLAGKRLWFSAKLRNCDTLGKGGSGAC